MPSTTIGSIVFEGHWLETLPVPFPKHYVLGFDDQKFEAEGVPEKYFDPQSGRARRLRISGLSER